MAAIDDLKATLVAINASIDGVQGAVDQVQADVQTLLDRLGSGEPPDLTEVQQMVQGIADRLATVKADLDSTPRPPEA